MLKALHERLAYAFIGFALGAIAAVALWYLYDLGFSRRPDHPGMHAGLWTWVKVVGGCFAAIGFLFRDRVGDAAGGASRAVYDYEARERHDSPEVPRWLAIIVLAGVAVAVWHFTR